jgi:hypothetical protein
MDPTLDYRTPPAPPKPETAMGQAIQELQTVGWPLLVLASLVLTVVLILCVVAILPKFAFR